MKASRPKAPDGNAPGNGRARAFLISNQLSINPFCQFHALPSAVGIPKYHKSNDLSGNQTQLYRSVRVSPSLEISLPGMSDQGESNQIKP
jgi:hypothetical protein